MKIERIKQIEQYLKDIEQTSKAMAETNPGEVRAMQLESIEFRIKKIKNLLEELKK